MPEMTGTSASGKSRYAIADTGFPIPQQQLELCLKNWRDMMAIVEAKLALTESQSLLCDIWHENPMRGKSNILSVKVTSERHQSHHTRGAVSTPSPHFWFIIKWFDGPRELAYRGPVYLSGSVRDGKCAFGYDEKVADDLLAVKSQKEKESCAAVSS